MKYRTKRHHTIYALTAAGARRLQELSSGSIEAQSRIRAAANLTNPDHFLWSNFCVLACEARGVHALTESELMAELNEGVAEKEKVIQGLLAVKTFSATSKSATARLGPDALAFETGGLTWFEIDASRRSPTRQARLLALVRALGTDIPVLRDTAMYRGSCSTLSQIVIVALEPSLLNRLKSLLDGAVTEQSSTVLTVDSGNSQLKKSRSRWIPKKFSSAPTRGYTYELWRAQYNDAGTHQIDVCVGRVALLLAPTWLPNYQGHNVEKNQPAGWFDEN